jgi:hypothetical protein
MNKQSDYFDDKLKSVSLVTRFLWWCAGADSYFLLRSPHQDRVKYAGIGGIVLATGFLAMASGGFAFRTAFGPKSMAGNEIEYTTGFLLATAVFSLVWGLMIFNLDRFIVSSTGKGDGTDKITLKEFGQAIPRIVIALILGLTISKPLEIEILKTEIDVELNKKQNEKLLEFNDATTARFQKELDRIDADIKKIETDRKVLSDRLKEAEQEYLDQMQGRAGMAGSGPRAKQLEVFKNEKAAELEEYDRRVGKQLENLESLRQKKLTELDYELNVSNLKKAHDLDGLLARIEISHELSWIMGVVLTLVFLSIEMGPIFFKMMMTKGTYDYMVENFNMRQNMENGIIREEHLYEGRDGALLMEKYRYLQVEAIQQEKEAALEAQKQVTTEIVGSWRNAQIKALVENPEAFHSTTRNPLA